MFIQAALKVSAFTLALVSLNAFATEYELDAAHTNLDFSVRHMMVHRTTGNFQKFEGTFTFDEKKPEASMTKFTVDASSINTMNADRDSHLRGAEFFDTTKHPKISFESTKVTSKGGKMYTLDGNLTMKGVTKPVSFETEYLGQTKDMKGKTTAGWVAKTKINRKDFGLTWNKVIEAGGVAVGEEVEITLNIAGYAKPTAMSKK
jgi:polyisoprenoid-binding protein YceI